MILEKAMLIVGIIGISTGGAYLGLKQLGMFTQKPMCHATMALDKASDKSFSLEVGFHTAFRYPGDQWNYSGQKAACTYHRPGICANATGYENIWTCLS